MPGYYYVNATVCSACSSPAATCSGASTPLTCVSGFYATAV